MDLGLGEVLGTRTRRQGVGINKYINNHLGFIFLGDMEGTWGQEGLADKEKGVGINMYINNHLGFIFLGDMGGTWG